MPAKRLRTETHCANGHLWADGNRYYHPADGVLRCRACNNEYQRQWQRARREKTMPPEWLHLTPHERRALAAKAARNRPGRYERNNAAIKAALARPEVRERMSAIRREIWKRPEYRARRAATMARPEIRKKVSEAIKVALRAKRAAAITEPRRELSR